MRKLATSLAVSLLILVITSHPAGALSGESGKGKGIDRAGGDFSFQATGTGTGTDATGTFRYADHSTGLRVRGDIDCLIVTTFSFTPVAVMTGVITRSGDPAFVGQGFTIEATDGSTQDGTTDGFQVDALNQALCSSPVGISAPIQKGEVTLVDV